MVRIGVAFKWKLDSSLKVKGTRYSEVDYILLFLRIDTTSPFESKPRVSPTTIAPLLRTKLHPHFYTYIYFSYRADQSSKGLLKLPYSSC